MSCDDIIIMREWDVTRVNSVHILGQNWLLDGGMSSTMKTFIDFIILPGALSGFLKTHVIHSRNGYLCIQLLYIVIVIFKDRSRK